jgi:menaquinone-dependent protoporphyrinogen IX oxidase
MKISINIPEISDREAEHWEGILRSFFNTVEEVLAKKRKASYLTHFFTEKLKKGERREFLRILAKIILQLKRKPVGPPQVLASATDLVIPTKYHRVIQSFQREVSSTTTSTHQSPKVRDTSHEGEDVTQLISEAIIENSKE